MWLFRSVVLGQDNWVNELWLIVWLGDAWHSLHIYHECWIGFAQHLHHAGIDSLHFVCVEHIRRRQVLQGLKTTVLQHFFWHTPFFTYKHPILAPIKGKKNFHDPFSVFFSAISKQIEVQGSARSYIQDKSKWMQVEKIVFVSFLMKTQKKYILF